MKVLSMIQPWAILFALGESQFETRTWKTNYRGYLAIHTSKKIDKTACNDPIIQKLLDKHGYTIDLLPIGLIIAKCSLENCIKVVENNGKWVLLEDGQMVDGHELLLGDYRVGNYAWKVKDMTLLDGYVPAKGRLGLWEYPYNAWYDVTE